MLFEKVLILIALNFTPDTLYAPHFNIPIMPYGMTYTEYRTLTYNFDVVDYATGMFFPGYFHFMVKKKTQGILLFIGRTLLTGFSIWGGALMYKDINSFNLNPDKYRNNLTLDFSIIMTGIMTNMFLYMVDLGHARWYLKERKMEIYYKYGIYQDQP